MIEQVKLAKYVTAHLKELDELEVIEEEDECYEEEDECYEDEYYEENDEDREIQKNLFPEDSFSEEENFIY